jgi:uncharacterized metal-binding protein YceD (DUF177 family)
MSEPVAEFSRPVPLARLSSKPFHQRIEATAEERERLARRFGLETLDNLTAMVSLRRQEGEYVLLEAEFEATLAQACVVTLEPVSAVVSGSFSLRYGPADEAGMEDDPSADTPVFEPLLGEVIDIGEAVAQELSLLLPEFPRHPDAVLDAAATIESADPLIDPWASLQKPAND